VSKSLQKYLTSIKSSILNPEEESSLIKLFKSKSKGWEDAQEKIIKSNSLYVVKLAYSFARKNEEVLDLISEGNLALLESLSKFDPNKKAKLLSYASFRIRGAMLAYRRKQSVFLNFKISEEINSLAKKTKEYILDYKLKHNQTPSISSIAKHCGIKENKAFLIAELAGINILSINATIEHEDKEIDLEYEDVEALNPFQEVDKAENSKIISKIIASLPLNRQIIINKRFGLNGEDFTDLATIGKQLNLTKERVRQIEKDIIQTIYKKWPCL
jgi:RNA polymerase sigma factor (sigma-70 family)